MGDNQFMFKYEFSDQYKVVVETKNETCDELVNDFVAFLRGCQFSDISIKEALEESSREINIDKQTNI